MYDIEDADLSIILSKGFFFDAQEKSHGDRIIWLKYCYEKGSDLTSVCRGGISAGLNLSLYLIRTYCGREVALQSSRCTLVDLDRILSFFEIDVTIIRTTQSLQSTIRLSQML